MRIKRIFAANTREALRKVKEQHGPDAVVLSSRSIDGGVEVISAIDYDEQAVQAAARAQDPRAAEIPPLEGSPGPRPGEPDTPPQDPQGSPASNGNSHGISAPSEHFVGQGGRAESVPSDDDAVRARQAALARLRRLRADGVADEALPDGLRQSAESHAAPAEQLALAQQPSAAALSQQQPQHRRGASSAPSSSAANAAQPQQSGSSAAGRRFSTEDLAGVRPGRLDLRVGGEDDEDAELFAEFSREYNQREQQRAANSNPDERGRAATASQTGAGKEQHARQQQASMADDEWVGYPHSRERDHERDQATPKRRGSNSAQDSELRQMREDISALRDLFESQLSLLEWGRMGRRHPARAGVIKRLADLGLGSDISKRLADHVGSDEDPNSAFRKALALIARNLPIAGDEIVNQGGVVALVGPTGVGKTTTVAKLAARYALRHGREKVALVSTDNYRVGAQDQLLTYARILDVPVYTATNRHELRNVVDDLAGRGLVLIDTVGMSQRDVRLAEQFKTLGSGEGLVRTYLVLSAATQLSTLTDSVSAFTGASPVGCILTKVDEATTLGGALTCALRTRLPLAYLATGQRVPEDLQAARGDTLVHRACVLLDEHKQELDEDALALSLGGGVHVPE